MRIGKALPMIIVSVILYFMPGISIAQQKVSSPYIDTILAASNVYKNNCGLDNTLKQLRMDPAYVAREKKMNDEIYTFITTPKRVRLFGPLPSISIVLPVVVHVINDNPFAITDAQIAAGIKDLNDAFSKSGPYSASGGADTKIQFVLAQRDPNGGITTGITRTQSHYGSNTSMANDDSRMKNLISWDPLKYINVWLVNNIIGEIKAEFDCGVWTRLKVGGYATMPVSSTSSSQSDGIVVPGFGIVMAHEMGHYLGLYHTFDGGCTNNNCLTDGDRVCDTPPDSFDTPVADCTKPDNSCKTDTLSGYSNGFFPKDTTDPVSNFMDYNNPACTNQFTLGQAERMQAAIATQRPGLISNAITKPCTEDVLAGFTRDIADPKIGETINFTNTSLNATSYEWYVDGALVSTATNLPACSFAISPAPVNNKHNVTLKAYKNGCMSANTDYILVNCGLTARFSSNKDYIASESNVYNDTILFTNNSMSTLGSTPVSYEWVLTNTSTNVRETITTNAIGPGGTNDLNYRFPTFGSFSLRLIATGGGCVDSSDQFNFTVADPKPDATITLRSVNCFQNTKVRVSFYVCNLGIDTIPPGMPITFYDADPKTAGAKQIGSTFLVPDRIVGTCCGIVYVDTLDVKYEKLNKIYAVANNVTTTVPIVLPDPAVTIIEKNYTNNISSYLNFSFKASIVPAAVSMEPGDTVQLSAQATPGPISSYAWSPPGGLSCTSCDLPFYYADTSASTTKQVIVRSTYQCIDTAYVDIKVPAYNDFSVKINSVACSGADSLSVNFTVDNLFKRGIIPKNLQVAFYKDDPQTTNGVLLGPVFKAPDSVLIKTKTYQWKIKKVKGGNIFASVNDNGSVVPVVSANAPMAEKDYTNNFYKYSYQLTSFVIDTAICGGLTFAGYGVSGTFRDTFLTASGCDSVRVINLTVKTIAVTRTTIAAAICEGESYAGHTTTGTFIDVYPGGNTCDSIRTLNLTVNPIVRKTNNVMICKGDSYSAGGKQQTQSGTYTDTAKSAAGCDSITTTILSVYSLPAAFLPKDTTLCLSVPLVLNLNAYTTVNWSTGSNSSSISITQPGTYSALVVDRNGCSGSASINVMFQKCIPIQIPNAFTPNSDGKNDVFRPLIGVATNNYTMQIWNRWGRLFFETHDSKKGWDGRYNGVQQTTGTFIYIISFTDPDGVAVYRSGTLLLLK
ncbi:MAG: M43 family zinc metalloprotease [Bacteroidota bacterium]